jgi:hypothetical protein
MSNKIFDIIANDIKSPTQNLTIQDSCVRRDVWDMVFINVNNQITIQTSSVRLVIIAELREIYE